MTTDTKKTKNFISYWYTRYELATELYMVEPWEKVVIYALFSVVFLLLWYFNTTVVISGISRLRSNAADVDQVMNYGDK